MAVPVSLLFSLLLLSTTMSTADEVALLQDYIKFRDAFVAARKVLKKMLKDTTTCVFFSAST